MKHNYNNKNSNNIKTKKALVYLHAFTELYEN